MIVFVSDNGPTTTATLSEEISMASAGPWRGELGDPWEGSIRTVGIVRWPGVTDGRVAHGMFSIMDFLPAFTAALGVEFPSDRPVDGIDQSDYLDGRKPTCNRDRLITFIDGRLAAVRWNQWRIYPTNFAMSDNNPSLGGYLGYQSETAGYPMIFTIESDPREKRAVTIEDSWVTRPYGAIIAEDFEPLRGHPNPSAANLTRF